jgi:hypothetical protein
MNWRRDSSIFIDVPPENIRPTQGGSLPHSRFSGISGPLKGGCIGGIRPDEAIFDLTQCQTSASKHKVATAHFRNAIELEAD